MMNRNGQDESTSLNPLLVVLLGGLCWMAESIIDHWRALLGLGLCLVCIAWACTRPHKPDADDGDNQEGE